MVTGHRLGRFHLVHVRPLQTAGRPDRPAHSAGAGYGTAAAGVARDVAGFFTWQARTPLGVLRTGATARLGSIINTMAPLFGVADGCGRRLDRRDYSAVRSRPRGLPARCGHRHRRPAAGDACSSHHRPPRTPGRIHRLQVNSIRIEKVSSRKGQSPRFARGDCQQSQPMMQTPVCIMGRLIYNGIATEGLAGLGRPLKKWLGSPTTWRGSFISLR